MADDPWKGFEEVKPAPKGSPAAAPDQWAGFEHVQSPAARDFNLVDLITSAVTPAAPVLRAADAVGGAVKDYVSGARRAAFQGATFGAGDEALAAGRSALPGGPTYDQALTEDRGDVKRFAQENPKLSMGSNLVGGIGSTMLLGRMLPQWMFGSVPGAPLYGRALAGAGAGAGWGGVSGFASGEGGLDKRLGDALVGAIVGGGIGGAMPLAMAGGKAAIESAPGRWIGENVVAPVARGASRVIDALTPTTTARSLSAAAPDSGPLPMGTDAPSLSSRMQNFADDAANLPAGGARRRIAEAMARDRMTPQQVGQRLGDLGEGATLMDAGGESLRRLGRTVNTMPGEGPQIMADSLRGRARDTSQRMVGDINRVAGDDAPFLTAFAKAQDARTKAADAAYQEARDAGLNISADMKRMMADAPALKRAWDQVVAQAKDTGEVLTPVDIAHRIKRTIADAADAAYRNQGISAKGAGDLAEKWTAALHSANPKIQAADAAFQAQSKVMDAMELGRTFMRSGVSDAADAVSPQAIARLSPAEKEGFAVGLFDTMRSIAGSGPDAARRLAKQLEENGILRAKLTEALGEKQARDLLAMGNRELTFQSTRQFVTGGPNTADKLVDVADQSALMRADIPKTPGEAVMKLVGPGIRWLQEKGAGNEAVRNEIARALSEQNLSVNALMLERLAKAIAKQQVVAPGQAAAPATAGMLMQQR